MDDAKMEDRRSHSRQLTCIPAYFESKADTQDLALIRDVSVSGARLFTRLKVDEGLTVQLHLYLGSETDEPRPVAGHVVRVDRRDPALADLWGWDVGVEFDAPISQYAAEIEQLCQRQQAAGILKR
jgi:hypothetical protein